MPKVKPFVKAVTSLVGKLLNLPKHSYEGKRLWPKIVNPHELKINRL